MNTPMFCMLLFLSTNAYPIGLQEEKCSEKNNADEQKIANNTAVSQMSSNFGKYFVGSNLFDGFRKTCFSNEEVNLLIARRYFEMMIPRDLPQDLLDDKAIGNIMRYFYYGLWLLRRIDDFQIRLTMEKAYYDTLGGFLAHYLVPVVKFSYYASNVELKTVRNVLALDKKCRIFLNTKGNGWRQPIKDPRTELSNVHITPLIFIDDSARSDEDKKYCTDLILNKAQVSTEIEDDELIVALPTLEFEDPAGYLGNICFPFSRKRTYNLRSCRSSFIFVKYYRSVRSCYSQKNLEEKTFDHKFRQWIVENIKSHLGDEVFYPGLGGILNIYETLMGALGQDKRRPCKIQEKGNETSNNPEFEEFESPDFSLKKRALENDKNYYMNNFENSLPIDSLTEIYDEISAEEDSEEAGAEYNMPTCKLEKKS